MAHFKTILVATAYPLHLDAFRHYLRGFYYVTSVHPSEFAQLNAKIMHFQPVALLMDNTFPQDASSVAHCALEASTDLGLIYLDAEPQLFHVLRCLELGFRGYLYLGDDLAQDLRQAVDFVRQSERFLSPSIAEIYEYYQAYRSLLKNMPPTLKITFVLMSKGLSAREIQQHLKTSLDVIYQRQFRLRQYLGVNTNEELLATLGLEQQAKSAAN